MSLISQYRVASPGDLIDEDLLNGFQDNIIDNGLIPSGIEGFSNTDSEMQIQVDPYPSSVISRSTDLAGEISRIRYVIKEILGESYWYIDPENSIPTISSDLTSIESTFDNFAANTTMVFYQSAAPTGWTIVSTDNDKALRLVSGIGGGSGGTYGLTDTLSFAHTHALSSHTHSLVGTHTHSVTSGSVYPYSPPGVITVYGIANTGNVTSGNTGAASATSSSDGTSTSKFAYIDIICCKRN